MSNKKKVIITGSTGMVGKGVLLECLDTNEIDQVLVINRRSIEMEHPKLLEIILPDFSRVADIEDQLIGYDACFFCMGTTALGKNETGYSKITYSVTKAFADTLFKLSPNMVFNYVSGTGTDSSEQGKSMWARIKGKTENMVFGKGFKDAYAFRPGFILPERGIKSATGWYNGIYALSRPFFPLLRNSKNITTTTKIGQAMIHTLFHSSANKHLENRDINALAVV